MTASSQYCVKLVTYLYLFWGFNQVWSLKVSLHNILDLCTTLTFDLYMFCEVSLVSLTYSFYLVFLIPFSSTEQKTQVSFSTRTVVCLSVKFSYFPLLLQNHWTNFNQTLAQNILGWRGCKFVQMKGAVLFKGDINEGRRPFQRGYNNEIAKIHWQN